MHSLRFLAFLSHPHRPDAQVPAGKQSRALLVTGEHMATAARQRRGTTKLAMARVPALRMKFAPGSLEADLSAIGKSLPRRPEKKVKLVFADNLILGRDTSPPRVSVRPLRLGAIPLFLTPDPTTKIANEAIFRSDAERTTGPLLPRPLSYISAAPAQYKSGFPRTGGLRCTC